MIDWWSEKVTLDHNDCSSPSPLLVLICRGHHQFPLGSLSPFPVHEIGVGLLPFDTMFSKVEKSQVKQYID